MAAVKCLPVHHLVQIIFSGPLKPFENRVLLKPVLCVCVCVGGGGGGGSRCCTFNYWS